ncbi:MAG: T9SS type A sorting domain-containing protein [Saprospiraceae bacterium]
MKSKMLFTFLFLALVSKNTFAQPIIPLEIQGITPKWLRYTFSPDLPRFLQLYELNGQPLLINKNMYLLHNITNNRHEGYFVENLDLETGISKWHDSYYATAYNTRRYAVPLTEEEDKIGMYYYQEWSETKPIIWLESRFNKIDYCIDSGEKCDSIITDVNDSLNAKILIAKYDAVPTQYATSLFSYQGITQYVHYYSATDKEKKKNYVPFEIYYLDDKGHKIDTNYFEIPTKYPAMWIQLQEYEPGKRIMSISSFNSNSVSAKKEMQLVYFDAAFNIEKIIDITDLLPKYTATSVRFIDKDYILLGNVIQASSGSNQYKIKASLFKTSGEFVKEVDFGNHMLNNINYDSYALTLFSNKQQVILATINRQGTEKIAEIVSSDEKDGTVLRKSFKFIGKDIGVYNLQAIGDSSLLVRVKYIDGASKTEYNVHVKWSTWMLFSLSSLGFTTTTKDINQSSFSFYPNPASAQLTIETPIEYDAVRIYSIDGKMIAHIDRRDNTLDISTLPSGAMYIFELWHKGVAVSRKERFVKME